MIEIVNDTRPVHDYFCVTRGFAASRFPIAMLLVLLLGTSQVNVCKAQTDWPPKGTPALSFDNVVVAKATKSEAGDSQISLLIPQWITETREVEKIGTRTEQKSRMVQRDGEEIEESYTGEVPVTYVEEITVQVFDGKGKRVDLDPTLVKSKRLDGTDVKPNQLANLLARPQRVFLLPSYAKFQPDPFYVSLIDPSTIVLFADVPKANHAIGN